MNLSFILQVVYDLIARLIPGSILIWCSYIIYFGYSKCILHFKTILDKTWDLNFLLIIEILLIAYIISIIFSGIWSLLSKKLSFLNKDASIIWKRSNQSTKDDIYKAIKSISSVDFVVDIEIPSSSFVYDFIRLKVPDVGARLVKVRAECHMCAVLIIGWIILSLLNILNFYHAIEEAIIIEIILVVSIIGVFLYLKNLEERFSAALRNY